MPSSKRDRTSKNKIYTQLRRCVILGHHRPGERLSIESLAESHGTSVTPVREALQMLVQDGLVTIEPHSGYYVSRINLKQLYDLFDLREVLEVAAVERAVTGITEEQLEQLERVNAPYTGDDDESIDSYVEDNRQFHCLVAAASGNAELAEMVARLHDRLARFIVIGGSIDTAASTHCHTIAALRSRDVAAARKAVLDEINRGRENIVRRVIQQEGPFWYLGERLESSHE